MTRVVAPPSASRSPRRGPISGGLTAACLFLFLLISAPRGAEGVKSSSAFVQNVVYSHRIAIFSKTYCPYSLRAKQIFEKLEEKTFVVELDERDDGREIQRVLLDLVGSYTVPQVFINGQHVGGSDDTAKALEDGRLKKLLGKSENSSISMSK